MEEPEDLEYYEVEPIEDITSLEEIKEMINEPPIIRLIDFIFNQAIQNKANEIHIEYSCVKFIINNVINETLPTPRHIHNIITGQFKHLANLNIDVINLFQDGKFSFQNEGKEYEAYLNITPGEKWEKAVIKISKKI